MKISNNERRKKIENQKDKNNAQEKEKEDEDIVILITIVPTVRIIVRDDFCFLSRSSRCQHSQQYPSHKKKQKQ